jgi:hypothetical protein
MATSLLGKTGAKFEFCSDWWWFYINLARTDWSESLATNNERPTQVSSHIVRMVTLRRDATHQASI